MGCAIARRDFLNGAAVALGAALAGPAFSAPPAPQDRPGYYPPWLRGMRGSHAGSFEAAHRLRDGAPLGQAEGPVERYDLVIVGGGISGLAAAAFYRASKPEARELILDNHDDFGGHAKRAVGALEVWPFDFPGFQGPQPRARRGPAHGLHRGGLCGDRGFSRVSFPGWQRLDRAALGAPPGASGDAGRQRRGRRHGARRL